MPSQSESNDRATFTTASGGISAGIVAGWGVCFGTGSNLGFFIVHGIDGTEVVAGVCVSTGITAQKNTNANESSALLTADIATERLQFTLLAQGLSVDFSYGVAITIDKSAIHTLGVEWNRDVTQDVNRDQAAFAADRA